jgi:hypothetical protein
LLAELAKQSRERVLLAGRLAGFATAMMVMMMCVTRALLLAELLNVLLDGGEIRLGCCGVTRFQILRELRNGDSQWTAALRAGCRRQ